MAIGQPYLNAIGTALGITAIEAGIMISLLFSILTIFVIVLATRGESSELTIGLTSLFTTLIFTFMGWYPVWVGSVLALVISILLATIFSGTGFGKAKK
jgi:hypothetical protein